MDPDSLCEVALSIVKEMKGVGVTVKPGKKLCSIYNKKYMLQQASSDTEDIGSNKEGRKLSVQRDRSHSNSLLDSNLTDMIVLLIKVHGFTTHSKVSGGKRNVKKIWEVFWKQ